MGVEVPVLLALVLVAALAGFVDAIAGGGGLLQLPALLVTGLPLPVALGVNKVSSICGTSAAVARYAGHGCVRWGRLAVAGPVALAASFAGVSAILAAVKTAAHAVEPAFAACFLALAGHQVWKATRPRRDAPPPPPRAGVGIAFVAAIGLYDGFIGPGTGMFLFWTFTTWWGMAPLEATGTTKAVNWLTNAGALALLISTGNVRWPLALAMAAANVVGGFVGAHTAIRRGGRFIRLTTAAVSAAVSVYLLVR